MFIVEISGKQLCVILQELFSGYESEKVYEQIGYNKVIIDVILQFKLNTYQDNEIVLKMSIYIQMCSEQVT